MTVTAVDVLAFGAMIRYLAAVYEATHDPAIALLLFRLTNSEYWLRRAKGGR